MLVMSDQSRSLRAHPQRVPSRHNLFSYSVQHDLRRIVKVELLHQMRAVRLDSVRADVQHTGDFLVRFAFCQQL